MDIFSLLDTWTLGRQVVNWWFMTFNVVIWYVMWIYDLGLLIAGYYFCWEELYSWWVHTGFWVFVFFQNIVLDNQIKLDQISFWVGSAQCWLKLLFDSILNIESCAI